MMRRLAALSWIVCVLALLASGCQLPHLRAPVSQRVANCRQLSQQGIAALERGEYEQAEALLAGAIKACDADPQARRYYAEALWQRGAGHEAITQLQQAVELSGEDAELMVRLAEMQLEKIWR